MKEKIILVDGHSIISRAYYGIPPLNNSRGLPTNGVYGFMNILYKYIDQYSPDYLLVTFDLKEPTFRHRIYSAYKGTRKPMPEDLHVQIPMLKELLERSGIYIVSLAGYEADDIIGTSSRIAKDHGLEVMILSGDRDMTQLIDEDIALYIPKTKGGYTETEIYRISDVNSKFGLSPKQMIEVKALQGDSSDNIPGVPGIGEKTALTLIQTYHDLDNLKAHLDEVTQPRAKNALSEHFDMAQMSRKLAEICLDAPITLDFDKARIGNLYTPEAYQYMGELELKNLMKRFDLSAINPESDKTKELPVEAVMISELFYGEVETVVSSSELLGVNIITSGGLYAAVTGDGTRILCLDETLFIRLAETLFKRRDNITVVTNDIQTLLRYMPLSQEHCIFDVAIAAYLLNPNQSTYQYDDISREYLDTILPTEKELGGKLEELAKNTGSVIYRAYPVLKEKLEEEGLIKLHNEIELPLAFSLHRMEKAGIRTDRRMLDEFSKKLLVSITEFEQKIYEQAGTEFNINSPKQLGEVLFEKMGLPSGKKTKTGYSTSADVLEKLRPAHPVIGMILEYRQLTKLYSTYGIGLQSYISDDGRIHGHFNQTIAATGRISSTEPNLQNIPVRMELGREIRKAFIPADGCVFLDADYSQIELRVLAHMSGDEKLIAAYNKDADIHKITASEVFHVPMDQVTSEQRRNAKAVNFGIVYGISSYGLSEGLSISRKEANEYIDRYFETYPKVKEFLDTQVNTAKRIGYVRTWYGRIRPIPELKSGNFNIRSFGERVAMNSPIQGTSADIIKLAMINMERALNEKGLKSRIILQVHDELLLEVPEEEKAEVKILLKSIMEGVADFSVPLLVEINEGKSWFETK